MKVTSKKSSIALLATLVAVVAVMLVVVSTAFAVSYSYSQSWNGGNGSGYNIPGANLLWVLSGGGSGKYTGGEIHITYSDDSSAVFGGTVVPGGGVIQFDTLGKPGLTVKAATAYYNAEKKKHPVLTISHTTSGEVTTTTVAEETSTTSTTVAEETCTTSTTVAEETSTTSTTVAEETSTTSTTVAEETSTTSTTVAEETSTTSTTVAEETSTTSTTVAEETSTTGGMTTVSEIQTGFGGSTGLGAGIWGLGALALALAGGLGWTALRPALRKNK